MLWFVSYRCLIEKKTENVDTIAIFLLYIYYNVISQQVVLLWKVYWVHNVQIWIKLRQYFSIPQFCDSSMLFLLNVGGENYDLEIVCNNIMFIPSLTLRRLMSYIYGAPILDVSRSHTTMQHSR